MVKKWAIQEKGSYEGGTYQAWREKPTRADRWDVHLELNQQHKSLLGIADKGQGEQSYDTEL